jgi:hypothetical protein
MNWFRNSPFASSDDAAAHMVALVAAEAEKVGTPLSEEDRRLLLDEWIPLEIDEEDPAPKFKKLIEQTFDHEADLDDPMSFSNSVQWAGAGRYPRIVALAEEIIVSRSEKRPRLRGRRAIVDLVQLIGCSVVTVILLMLFAAFVGWLFGHH